MIPDAINPFTVHRRRGRRRPRLLRLLVSLWLAVGVRALAAPAGEGGVVVYTSAALTVTHEAGRFRFQSSSVGGPEPAGGPPTVSQIVGMTNPVLDEYGYVLPGTEPDAYVFGHTVVVGDVAQVLLATDGVIYPPDTHGAPHPSNVVIHSSRIGLGQSPTLPRPGKFAGVITPRPGGGSRIFARVFNAATLAEASFYGDSQLFTVSSSKDSVFIASIAALNLPLDPVDANGDGTNNSQEKSLAHDRDLDGFSTADELVAGTDPKDVNSRLAFTSAQAALPGGILLQWPAITGRTYAVERVSSGQVSLLATVTGVGEILLPADLISEVGWFRVCVLMDELEAAALRAVRKKGGR